MSGIGMLDISRFKLESEKTQYHMENAIEGLKKLDAIYSDMITKLDQAE